MGLLSGIIGGGQLILPKKTVNQLNKSELGSYINRLNTEYSKIVKPFEDDDKFFNPDYKTSDFINDEYRMARRRAEEIKKEVQRQYKRYMKM